MCIGTESIAEGLGRQSDGGDDEPVAGEGGDSEVGQADADLVYVVHHNENACLLQVQGRSMRNMQTEMRHELYLAVSVTDDATQVIQDADLGHRGRMEPSHARSEQEVSRNRVSDSHSTYDARGI